MSAAFTTIHLTLASWRLTNRTMILNRKLMAALSLAATAAVPAYAQVSPRIRGEVVRISGAGLSIRQQDGRVIALKTHAKTIYATVVPARLEDIKPADFVGTASKGRRGEWVAVEIVIIPEDMRAGRAGFAGWDPIPDPAAEGSKPVATTMANGVVASAPVSNTSMTNGVVRSTEDRLRGRDLHVDLVGGERVGIFVPAGAPITRFVRSSRSEIKVGDRVFVKTDTRDEADLIAAGRGVIPPM